VVADAAAAWGALHGVVHAAGAAPGGLVQAGTPERLAEALAPRVAGTLVLDEVTEGMALDFMVLTSSLHALYGGVGAMDGSAADAFLDAFAAMRGQQGGRPVVSIAWDGWSGAADRAASRLAHAASNETVNGADGEGSLVARLLRSAVAGITPREGGEAFERVLAHGFGPRVAVCTRDLTTAVEEARRITRRDVEAALESRAGARAAHPRPAGAGPYVEPRSDLERTLAEMYRRALGIDPIGCDDDFFELGGDSLLATQLLSALNARFQVNLPLRALFEAATPARLAVAVVQMQAEQVDDDLLAQALAEL
jgi:phthiocerol/phenolphthiocerol synthesis type-I polyketide synthase E